MTFHRSINVNEIIRSKCSNIRNSEMVEGGKFKNKTAIPWNFFLLVLKTIWKDCFGLICKQILMAFTHVWIWNIIRGIEMSLNF